MSRLILFFCLLLAVYFTYTAMVGGIRQREQNAEHEVALAEIEILRAKRDHLLAVQEYVASDDYVEQAARRELGYVRAGESAFVVISPALSVSHHAPAESQWWVRLFPQ